MDNDKANFANTINEIGLGGVIGSSECHNFRITWGCSPDCPVFERGECEIQADNQKIFDKEEAN